MLIGFRFVHKLNRKARAMNKTEQIRLIREAFDAIPSLQDGFWDVRERLQGMNAESERGHRKISGDRGITVPLASILFVVKHLLDGHAKPNHFSVDDITSIRLEVLYAQAYAKRFHKELAEWAKKYRKAFEQVDYAFLMQS